MIQVHTGIELNIKDDAGKPISNAIITLNSYKVTRKSDDRGRFYEIVMPGSYNVHVQAPGFDIITQVRTQYVVNNH